MPVSEPFPWVAAILFCLLMPSLTGLAGAVAMRGVVIGPLGVARRHRRGRPPGWPAVLLVSGPFAIAIANRLTALDVGGAWQPVLVIGVAATCVGMLSASAWLAGAIGTVTGRLTGRADLLIAARRLETDPYGQSWAMSSVVILTFFASAIAIVKADILASQPDQDFYARSFELINLGLLIAVSIAAAGLLVALAEGVMDRRRSLAALVAAGTPLGVLRRALLLQGLLPLVPAVLLAAILGSMAFFAITGSPLDSQTVERVVTETGEVVEVSVPGTPFPFTDVAVIAIVGVAASLLATSLSLPLLDRSIRPSELRFE